MGILDSGRIEGFTMTKYQQDHVRLCIQDTFERYTPKVAPHLYKVRFKPVIDQNEDELESIEKWMNLANSEQDRNLPHLLRTLEPCWCDNDNLAQFASGKISPFFVIELELSPWNPKDARNCKLFPQVSSVFIFAIFCLEVFLLFRKRLNSKLKMELFMLENLLLMLQVP